jgi:hypothetical protein
MNSSVITRLGMRNKSLGTACAVLASMIAAGVAPNASAIPAWPKDSGVSVQAALSTVQYRPAVPDEEDEPALMEAPPVIYERSPGYRVIAPRPYAPGVYGYVAERPTSCGEFRYWNGVRCVDARDNPPDLGPRW